MNQFGVPFFFFLGTLLERSEVSISPLFAHSFLDLFVSHFQFTRYVLRRSHIRYDGQGWHALPLLYWPVMISVRLMYHLITVDLLSRRWLWLRIMNLMTWFFRWACVFFFPDEKGVLEGNWVYYCCLDIIFGFSCFLLFYRPPLGPMSISRFPLPRLGASNTRTPGVVIASLSQYGTYFQISKFITTRLLPFLDCMASNFYLISWLLTFHGAFLPGILLYSRRRVGGVVVSRSNFSPAFPFPQPPCWHCSDSLFFIQSFFLSFPVKMHQCTYLLSR